MGEYRLKLEVTAPNGLKEPTRYQYFHYDRSGFTVTLGKIQVEGGLPATRFISGQTYTIPIKVKNQPRNNYDVKNGSCTLVLQAENGSEAYRKEITGIELKSGEEKELLETFTFAPTGIGVYSLLYRFWDETIEKPSHFSKLQYFNYRARITITPDDTIYISKQHSITYLRRNWNSHPRPLLITPVRPSF
jgi:hypothetical protein